MKMKKFINNPDNLTTELLEGMVAAYPNKIKLDDGKIVASGTHEELLENCAQYREIAESQSAVGGDL